MKNFKTRILALLICLFMVSNHQAQNKKTVSKSYVLEGNITGIEDGTVVKLVPGATHTTESAVAETTIKDGKFTFTGSLKEPRLFYVTFGDNNGFINAMVENAKIKITAKAVTAKEGGRISFTDAVISGSKSQDYYAKETAFRIELEKDYRDYQKEAAEQGKIYYKARVDGNRKVMDSIEKTPEWKRFEVTEKAFFAKVEKKSSDLIIKHKDSWWGPFFLMTQYSYLRPEQKQFFNQFSDAVKNTYYAKLAKEEIYPKSLIGTKVSDFNLKDKDGKSISLKEVISGKKYILIDFWASWCAPCRKEIPNLKTAYADFAAKGFEVLSISIDKDQKAWLKALGQENMQWHNLLDDSVVKTFFNVKAIPATFLVDSKGIIISDNLRGAALEEKLKELLKS